LEPKDIIIVGAGVFGASAALELRRRGHAVTLVDPGPLPHPDASSTDVSKMVRADYGKDDFYSRFALECITGWKRWNVEMGQPLYHETGFLVLAGGQMRPGGFEHDSREVLLQIGGDIDRLDGAELHRRFPAWPADRYPDGYFNPMAGWAESRNVVSWLLAQAVQSGVLVRETSMAHCLEEGSRIRGIVTSDGHELLANTVIVAAGAWTPTLLPWLEPALQCVGQPVYHFLPADPEPYRSERFPPWAADIANTGWYGFPVQSDGILKIANHGSGVRVDPRADKIVPAVNDERFLSFAEATFPGLEDSPIVKRRLCLYCDSWDGDLWIDWDPDREGLLVAAGGSGHGFKFAPGLGHLIADKVEGTENRWADRFRWRPPGARRTEAARSSGEATSTAQAAPSPKPNPILRAPPD
jgi:glycine/D-amino acid oxidase-like deaminating enzyme